MDRGLLWYDDDPNLDLIEKVKKAAQRYSKKFGELPDACYVHPSALDNGDKAAEIDAVRILPLSSILLHHFWLGQEEKRKKPRAKGTKRG